MSGIQLTYDSRQDRILLLSGMDIAMPDWWLTRREVKKGLKSITSVTTSQYETEKMLEQFTSTMQSAARTEAASSDKTKTYREFHQEHAGQGQPTVSQSRQVEPTPGQYPLAVKATIDITDQQGIKLFLLSNQNRGVCLEFTQEGLYRFNNMLFTVAQKAQWL